MIEVGVEGVLFDRDTDLPVVVLRERNGNRVLPIFIGPNEAQAIIYVLSGERFVRPLTVDLMNLLIAGLHGVMRRAVVTRLAEGTFYAELVLDSPQGKVSIDARPSDAIALALRAGAAIGVAEAVMDEAGLLSPEGNTGNPDELRARLREITPEDFGNYRMP